MSYGREENTISRVIFAFILPASILLAPWQVTFVFMIASLLMFRWPLEVLFAALVINLLYGQSTVQYWANPLLITFVVLIALELFIKPRLRYYDET